MAWSNSVSLPAAPLPSTCTTVASFMLHASTVKTLGEVFAALDLYPTRRGEVIAVATAAPVDAQILERRAAALQELHGFRFSLPDLLRLRMDKPHSQAAGGDVITDDFAPAD